MYNCCSCVSLLLHWFTISSFQHLFPWKGHPIYKLWPLAFWTWCCLDLSWPSMDTDSAVRTFSKPFTFFTFHKCSISQNETIFFFKCIKEEKLKKAVKGLCIYVCGYIRSFKGWTTRTSSVVFVLSPTVCHQCHQSLFQNLFRGFINQQTKQMLESCTLERQSTVGDFNPTADLWILIHSFPSIFVSDIFSYNELCSRQSDWGRRCGLQHPQLPLPLTATLKLPDSIQNDHPEMSLTACIAQFTSRAGLTFPYSRQRLALVSQSQPGCWALDL